MEKIPYIRKKTIPFFLIHFLPLMALFTGVKPIDWLVMVAIYFWNMFFVTGGYHRYFSHGGYEAGPIFRFFLAWNAQATAQKGVIWWAAHHKDHHVYSDTDKDPHDARKGFWWSHVLWILHPDNDHTNYERVPHLTKHSELVWLNKHYLVPPIVNGTVVGLLGLWLHGSLSMLWIGFFGAMVLTWHGTFFINSLNHIKIYGSKRRYATEDSSQNNLFLALLTLGEGWHNNHHHYCRTARQGFYPGEIDITYSILELLSKLRLVWGLKQVPEKQFTRDLISKT